MPQSHNHRSHSSSAGSSPSIAPFHTFCSTVIHTVFRTLIDLMTSAPDNPYASLVIFPIVPFWSPKAWVKGVVSNPKFWLVWLGVFPILDLWRSSSDHLWMMESYNLNLAKDEARQAWWLKVQGSSRSLMISLILMVSLVLVIQHLIKAKQAKGAKISSSAAFKTRNKMVMMVFRWLFLILMYECVFHFILCEAPHLCKHVSRLYTYTHTWAR